MGENCCDFLGTIGSLLSLLLVLGGQTIASVEVKYLIKLPQSNVCFRSDVPVFSLENMAPGALQGSALGMVPNMPSANGSA
jgi:hypothetical protein